MLKLLFLFVLEDDFESVATMKIKFDFTFNPPNIFEGIQNDWNILRLNFLLFPINV